MVCFSGEEKISHHLQNNWGILGEQGNQYFHGNQSIKIHRPRFLFRFEDLPTNRPNRIPKSSIDQTVIHARVNYDSCFQKQRLSMPKSCFFVQLILGPWRSRLTKTFGPKSFAKPTKTHLPFLSMGLFLIRHHKTTCTAGNCEYDISALFAKGSTEGTVHGTTHHDVSSFMVLVRELHISTLDLHASRHIRQPKEIIPGYAIN